MKATIRIAYETALSKNRTHGYGRGRVWRKGDTDKAMWDISILLKPPFYGYKWTHEKIYVSIMAHRPDMRGDMQNFVDSVCDAVRDAIKGMAVNQGLKLDDNIFAIGGVDWVVDKDDPHLLITVEQADQ